MALGIGQQLRNMVDRARHYWADLTDEGGTHRRHEQQEREDAVHQRYGGVPDRDEPDADLSQRHRQYTQQGGSGTQKTLGEQLGEQAPRTGSPSNPPRH